MATYMCLPAEKLLLVKALQELNRCCYFISFFFLLTPIQGLVVLYMKNMYILRKTSYVICLVGHLQRFDF